MNKEILKKIAQEVVKFQNHGNTTTNIVKVQRPEGTRFYKGTGIGANSNVRKNEATFNALLKSKHNPADSVTTKQVEQFRGDKK